MFHGEQQRRLEGLLGGLERNLERVVRLRCQKGGGPGGR